MASEFVEILSPGASDDVKGIIADLNKIRDLINDINKNSRLIQLPSQARSNSSASNNANAQMNRSLTEQERLINRINDARKTEAIELAKLRVELANLNRENKKAAQDALGVLTSYQKLSAELNELRSQAKAVAADMFLLEQAGEQNSDAYRELSATYANLSQRVTTLNDGLTRIDRGLGDHRRNVGNYESAWNGLGNAINQLTREAPAFAVSLNTGFLAISNNLPMLIDEINRLQQSNENLRAEGRPTVSVFRQIVSSLFSWQTALSAGITLLTVYGGKLIDWAFSVKKATGEIDQLTAATQRYQDTIVETTTTSERELTALKNSIAVIQDKNKSDKERISRAEELISKYPGYLENLTAEELLLGSTTTANEKYNKSIRSLTADIQKRADAEAKQNAARETLKIVAEIEQEVAIRRRANDEARDAINNYGFESAAAQSAIKSIREQIAARIELSNENKDFVSKFGEVNAATSGSVTGLGLYLESQITELELKGQSLRNEYEKQADLTNKVIQETSLLDYNPSKEEDAKETQIANLADFEASRYELLKTRLEYEAGILEETFNNEEVNYAEREAASRRFSIVQSELAELRRDEELRLIKKTTDDEIAELDRRVKEGEITQKNRDNVVSSLQKQAEYDSLKAHEDYAESIRLVNKGITENLKGVWDAINFQKATNLISDRDLRNTEQYGKQLQDLINKNADYRDIEKATKDYQAANRKVQSDTIRTEIERIETELRGLKDVEANVQKRLELEESLLKKKKELADATNQQYTEEAAALERLQKATESYLEGFKSNALSDFGLGSLNTFLQVEENGKTMFQNLMAGADTAAEKFAVAFNTITSVMSEAFDFVNQNQQAMFDAQYANLEKSKDLALKYAGESADGREAIENEYAERQREIRMREAKAEKQQAIFKIAIATAQGVVAALASIPPNIPLSIAIAGIGAAQAALVASQEIPAYAEGTDNHPGGLMMVNDAKGSNYRELISTPDGKAFMTNKRNAILDMPKGTKVLKAGTFESELSSMLKYNGIQMAAGAILSNRINASNGLTLKGGATASEIDNIMGKHLGSLPSYHINMDKKGFGTFTSNAHGKKVNLNNAIEFKSKNT